MTEQTPLFPDLPGGQPPAEPCAWPLAFVTSGGVWSCAWCAAELTESKITHRGDCRWVTDFTARCRAEGLRALAADLRATGKLPDFRSRQRTLDFAAKIAENEADKL